jgi:preprotein translocase subunit SecA
MQEMRRGIGLRGYGQRDPLVEYKKEAYMLYNELKALIEKQVVYSIFKVADVGEFKAPDLSQRAKNFSAPAKTMEAGSSSFGFESGDKGAGGSSGDFVKQVPRNEDGEKVGRNDPCPCGSGKKYKKCHGR